MKTTAPSAIDNALRSSIVSTLGYYGHFKYPLKANEILGNLPQPCSASSLMVALKYMVSSYEVYCDDGFYSLDENIKPLTARRKDANKLAMVQLPMALRIGAFIYKFPFVKFVGISGSLSKGYADDQSDFDFFIVTAKNRLWICRTILHMFKKLTFLWGAQHKFCMNYFIDTSSLEIEEKNRYTAIELASVIPAAGSDVYERLMAQNPWVKGYLSNGYCHFVPKPINVANKSPLLKRSLEFFLSAIFPDKLNYLLMDITDKKWKAKWRKRRYPMEEYGCAFKTTLHISKNHPANHQKKVLENLSKFEMPKQPNQKQPCLED